MVYGIEIEIPTFFYLSIICYVKLYYSDKNCPNLHKKNKENIPCTKSQTNLQLPRYLYGMVAQNPVRTRGVYR